MMKHDSQAALGAPILSDVQVHRGQILRDAAGTGFTGVAQMPPAYQIALRQLVREGKLTETQRRSQSRPPVYVYTLARSI